MRESEAVAALRRDLGRQLAIRRKAAGYVQRELGVLVGYSRTAIANAETGGTKVGRQLWQRADQVLQTGELFSRGYERIQAQIAAEARADAGRMVAEAGTGEHGRAVSGLESAAVSQAMNAYMERGWPVVGDDQGGRLWLLTGREVDALEVSRQAGILAIGWWLYTRGLADEIRKLPALPDPAGALAAVIAGPRCYFLTQSGMCPWTRRDSGMASQAGQANPAVVRWHAEGGRIPAPPSRLDGGELATWAHAPSGSRPLVSPMALLHVLAQAAAATSGGVGVLLPGGVRAVPAPAQ